MLVLSALFMAMTFIVFAAYGFLGSRPAPRPFP